MLVNGTAYPYLQVEPRRYRFRILNACNTRVLTSDSSCTPPARRSRPTRNPTSKIPGPVDDQLIGTEGGFLDGGAGPEGVSSTTTRAAMPLVAGAGRARRHHRRLLEGEDGRRQTPVLLHPAQRRAGARSPAARRWRTSTRTTTSCAVPPAPGYGPNTRTLLQFQVVPLGSADRRYESRSGRQIRHGRCRPHRRRCPRSTPCAIWRSTRPSTSTVASRRISEHSRRPSWPRWTPPTEVVQAGTVETWRIFNITADTHPIHFHYFNVRVVSREAVLVARRRLLPSIVRQAAAARPGRAGLEGDGQVQPGRVHDAARRCAAD